MPTKRLKNISGVPYKFPTLNNIVVEADGEADIELGAGQPVPDGFVEVKGKSKDAASSETKDKSAPTA